MGMQDGAGITPRRRLTTGQIVAFAFGVLIVVAIFAFAVPRFADYSAVWAAMKTLTPVEFWSLMAAMVFNLYTYWLANQAGLIGMSLGQSAVVTQTSTSVANTLVIQSLSPFIAGLGGWLFLGERVRSRTWIAMGVALLGTVMMLWGSAGAGSRIGDLLALGTATAFAGATVVVRWNHTVPMPASAALAAALGAVLAFSWAEPSSASAGNLALLALFGIGQLGSGLLLFTAGARLIPVAEASLIAVLECVLGPLWVWLAVGERPGAFSLIGGAVILSALVAHTAADLARPPRPPGARVE